MGSKDHSSVVSNRSEEHLAMEGKSSSVIRKQITFCC